MITVEQVLQFKSSADLLYQANDYTSATILYFKALCAIHDYMLLKKTGESPKDHGARFRLLEKHFPDLYHELDLEFTTYQDTYSKVVDKDTCTRIKKRVENGLKRYQITA